MCLRLLPGTVQVSLVNKFRAANVAATSGQASYPASDLSSAAQQLHSQRERTPCSPRRPGGEQPGSPCAQRHNTSRGTISHQQANAGFEPTASLSQLPSPTTSGRASRVKPHAANANASNKAGYHTRSFAREPPDSDHVAVRDAQLPSTSTSQPGPSAYFAESARPTGCAYPAGNEHNPGASSLSGKLSRGQRFLLETTESNWQSVGEGGEISPTAMQQAQRTAMRPPRDPEGIAFVHGRLSCIVGDLSPASVGLRMVQRGPGNGLARVTIAAPPGLRSPATRVRIESLYD